MHPDAIPAMERLLSRAPHDTQHVLDVGALDVNGTYRPLIESRGWTYLGLDIVAGENVDIVAPPYQYPFSDGEFDVVTSGSTAEHVERPWLWFPELARVLRPGGLLAILTHWQFKPHRYPKDCWRFMPDGMQVLFDDTACLSEYYIKIVSKTDIVGSAIRV